MGRGVVSGEDFGRLVKARRLARGWSRERLAEAALGGRGAERRIAEIEEGHAGDPPVRIADAIAHALGISAEDRAAAGRHASEPPAVSAPAAILERAREALAAVHPGAGPGAAERRAAERLKTAGWIAHRRRMAEIAKDRPAIRPILMAAQAAAEHAHFGEADALLAEAEGALRRGPGRIELRRERGEAALLACEPQRAWRCFEAAAAFFDPYTPDAGADLRMAAAAALHRHGRLFGPEGTEMAALLLRKAAETWRPERKPERWATAWSNLAGALHDVALARGGEAAEPLLEESAEAYRKALKTFDPAKHPGRWATAQSNLATTLGNLARRRRGDAAAKLFAEAAAAHRAALELRSRAAKPADWAAAQAALGLALGAAAAGSKDSATAKRLLGEAAAAGAAALGVYSRESTPAHWAAARNNLGMTLRAQAAAGGPTQLLAQAAACFRESLGALAGDGPAEETRRATIRTNLALTLTDLAARAAPESAAAFASEAAGAARAALAARAGASVEARAASLAALAGALVAEAAAAHGPASARAASEAAALLRHALADAELSADPARAAAYGVALGRALELEAAASAPETRRRRLAEAGVAYGDVVTRLGKAGPAALRAAAETGLRRAQTRRAA